MLDEDVLRAAEERIRLEVDEHQKTVQLQFATTQRQAAAQGHGQSSRLVLEVTSLCSQAIKDRAFLIWQTLFRFITTGGVSYAPELPAELKSRVGHHLLNRLEELKDFVNKASKGIGNAGMAAEMLSQMLVMSGFDCTVAYDGEQALCKAELLLPDAALLDIGLPDFDGYELCRRIRRASLKKQPVLIALTGWGQDRDKEQAVAAGFDGHLTKPADPGKVEALLAKLLAQPAR